MQLGFYLRRARRWALFAILPALIVAGAGYFYGLHQPKMYQATATLYIDQGSTGVSSTVQADPGQLAQTYAVMINSPAVSTRIDRDMGHKYPGYFVASHNLQASQPLTAQPSSLLTISVTDTLPQRAAAAADTAAHVFAGRVRNMETKRFGADAASLQRQVNAARTDIQNVTAQINAYHGNPAGLKSLKLTLNADETTYSSLLASLEQFNVMKDGTVPSLSLLTPATVASVGPSAKRDAILAGFLALLLFGAILLAYDYLDDSISKEDIQELTGAPVLGEIERFRTRTASDALVTAKGSDSALSDAYRIIRTSIQFINIDGPPRTIVVTSAKPGEGKSTTISNLARVFAEGGNAVTLVDADLRRPTLHQIFEQDVRPGLTGLLLQEHLNGHGTLTDHENLKLVTAGWRPQNPADLLVSKRMQALLSHISGAADTVLLDSPPVLSGADAAILAAMSDGVLLVVDTSRSKRRDVRRARAEIEAVGGKIIGVVMNRVRRRDGYYSYYYSSTGSYLGDAPRDPTEPEPATAGSSRSRFSLRK